MARNRALALVFLAPILLSGCGSSDSPEAAPAPATATATDEGSGGAQGALPDRVRVKCSPHGVTVSSSEIAAQAAGVVLVVSSTMRPGTYLSYASDGAGSFAGGDPLPSRPFRWALPLAPGTITLACSPDGEEDPAHTAKVRVSDPGGFWRGESLAKLGCDLSGGQPSWVAGLGGTGSTAKEAVQQTLDAFEALANSQHRSVAYTARPAEIGYSGAATQTWVAMENGRAKLTIDVTHARGHYTAYPDHLCHD